VKFSFHTVAQVRVFGARIFLFCFVICFVSVFVSHLPVDIIRLSYYTSNFPTAQLAFFLFGSVFMTL